MKKLFASISAIALTMALSLSVSANTVYYKDFTDGVLEPFEIFTNANMFDVCEYEFTDAGLRLYNIDQNYKSYTLPFGKSGIELNSDKYYLITFEGVVTVDNPDSYEMIVQLFAIKDGSDNWININGKDGLVVSDDGAYSINADGTFKVEALVTPDQISFDKQGTLEHVCVWAKYGNSPREYTVSYVKIQECDENGNVEGEEAAEEAVVETAAATPATGSTTAAASSDKGSADTGAEGIAVVAGLALAAAGAVVISRKRK